MRARFASEPDARRGVPVPRTSRSTSPAVDAKRARAKVMRRSRCTRRRGAHLPELPRPVAFKTTFLAVRHRGWTVAETLERTVDDVLAHFASDPPLTRALGSLSALGLGYLPLGQPLATLSGGEAQRVKLARALTEDQKDALLVLDEPSAGLHPADVERLIQALGALVKGGASVVVVEHDVDVMRAADWIIDLGPVEARTVARSSPRALPRRWRVAGSHRDRAAGVQIPARARYELRKKKIDASWWHAREAQSARVIVAPARQAGGRHWTERIGQEHARFRRGVCRRAAEFLETLTPYARQFLPTMPRPDVDRVTGVPPSIALEQRTRGRG